jgi:hypothetical protein
MNDEIPQFTLPAVPAKAGDYGDTDAQTALQIIQDRIDTGNPMNVSESRELANSVDAGVGDSTLMLFSGSSLMFLDLTSCESES